MKILKNTLYLEKEERFINLNNVKSFDINKNVVRFKNKVTNLVARDKKRELKDRLINKNIFL